MSFYHGTTNGLAHTNKRDLYVFCTSQVVTWARVAACLAKQTTGGVKTKCTWVASSTSHAQMCMPDATLVYPRGFQRPLWPG